MIRIVLPVLLQYPWILVHNRVLCQTKEFQPVIRPVQKTFFNSCTDNNWSCGLTKLVGQIWTSTVSAPAIEVPCVSSRSSVRMIDQVFYFILFFIFLFFLTQMKRNFVARRNKYKQPSHKCPGAKKENPPPPQNKERSEGPRQRRESAGATPLPTTNITAAHPCASEQTRLLRRLKHKINFRATQLLEWLVIEESCEDLIPSSTLLELGL